MIVIGNSLANVFHTEIDEAYRSSLPEWQCWADSHGFQFSRTDAETVAHQKSCHQKQEKYINHNLHPSGVLHTAKINSSQFLAKARIPDEKMTRKT